jgi:polar amino acid transport system substrate-binding protein
MVTGTKRALLGLAGLLFAGAAHAQAPPLRAAYLNGNPVQAFSDAKSGALRGPSVDLARAIADALNRPLEMVPAQGPDGVLGAVREGRADLGFVAFDPSRSAGVTFSAPYLMSLNSYAVRADGKIKTQDTVDAPGVRVGANATDTGGLYLQRTLKAATLTPIATPEAGRDMLADGRIDALALNGQRLADLVGKDARFKILPGYFYAVPQTVAVRADNTALQAQVAQTVDTSVRNGFVARSIKNAGLVGVEAAQPNNK